MCGPDLVCFSKHDSNWALKEPDIYSSNYPQKLTKANYPSYISPLPQNNTEVICHNNLIHWHVNSRWDNFPLDSFSTQCRMSTTSLALQHLVTWFLQTYPIQIFSTSVSKIWRTNSVKALTYAENSFCFFRKQCSVTHSKSCAPCLGFKGLYQRMGSLPFHLNLSLFPPGPEASLDPVSSVVFFSS